jgi:hypothetical protein
MLSLVQYERDLVGSNSVSLVQIWKVISKDLDKVVILQ